MSTGCCGHAYQEQQVSLDFSYATSLGDRRVPANGRHAPCVRSDRRTGRGGLEVISYHPGDRSVSHSLFLPHRKHNHRDTDFPRWYLDVAGNAQNFGETFPLFAAGVLIAHVAGAHRWMTEWGVQLFFGGRVAYLALYAAGVFLLRSLVWDVAVLGIVLILLSLV